MVINTDMTHATSTTTVNPTKAILTVFLTIFIDMLGVGIFIPIFPLLVLPHSEFRVIPASWTIQQGFILLGWLGASFPLAQFIFSPILGQLADKFGRKKVLALSIAGTSLAYFLLAYSIYTKNIPLMFFSRILDGITGGNISVAQAVIADISTPSNRAKNFGMIGMAFGLGFIMGPFIGGKLADPTVVSWFGSTTPFLFAGILSLLNMCSILILLPETLKFKNVNKINIFRPVNNLIVAFSQKNLRNIMPTTFLYNAGFNFFVTFFAVTLAEKYGFSQGHIGDFFAYVGIMIVFAQGVIVRRISKQARDFKVLRYSIFGAAATIFAYRLVPASHGAWLFFIPPFMSTCNALTSSFSSALIARVTPEHMRAQGMGINSSVMAIAQTIPAILAGYIAGFGVTIPMLIGSITIAIAGISFWLFFDPKEAAEFI